MTAAVVTNEIESPDKNETSNNETSEPLLEDETHETDETVMNQNNENSLNSDMEEQNLTLNKIFKYLSKNSSIIFKSQQIDDPEITIDEKFEIAKNEFTESNLKFLRKFGRYLTKEHLEFLQELESFNTTQDYETNYLFRNLITDLDHRESNIKNRRFTAMKNMILEQNEYFSETEMMKREPLLYEQLVGQYLTESEKNVRDGYNPKTTLFSQILLDKYDRDERDKLRKRQELMEAEAVDNEKESEEDDNDDESTHCSFTSSKITHLSTYTCKGSEEKFPKIPPSFKKRWGSFEDDEDNTDINIISTDQKSVPGTSSTSLNKLIGVSKVKQDEKLDAKQKYVTASEREMLRQEFLGIMRSKFIDGIDKDYDYSNIDNNSELDDLIQINQDCEDKYFEDNDIDDQQNEIIEEEKQMDDDLDIYMKNLNKKVDKNEK